MAEHHLLHEPLEIQFSEHGDTAVVRISGACDVSCHDQLRDRLLEAEARGPRHVVVDLTGLRFIDSLGLRVVISAWNRARCAGHRFSVALADSGQVRSIFAVTGVDRIVSVNEPARV
jgi:anti-sigma B factor antagonist